MSEQFKKTEKGLACCERRGYCEGHCPYYEPEKGALECTSELAHDAHTMIRQQAEEIHDLKTKIHELQTVQTARVMTLEDVDTAEACMEPVFVEMLDENGKPGETPDIFSWRFVKHIMPLTDGKIYVLNNVGFSSALYEETYNITWRCWTSWPTDEQRKAVKWDE